jgi:serine/threonine protein kinase
MSGVEKVEAYLAAIKPADADSKHSSWSVDQLRATPTLLPNLRFHDLVFGKELGSGAFSTVKYARRINKSSTRSKWSEYGVKIISRSKIEELGYSRSVEREIASLRILANPNIARLVSEFRFRDGAYLVLEYASKYVRVQGWGMGTGRITSLSNSVSPRRSGDLHTLIFDNGSLDDDSAQFVIGEVLAALSSIHDAGFMFGDLKPENVLITEAGHIKLGDFGGCRAVTEDAKRLLRESTSAVEDLRDGDWRAAMKGGGWGGEEKGGDEEMKDVGEEKGEEKGGGGEEEGDHRGEGTPAYMSPEAAAGVRPTRASDMWSFGCVLFACIAGRPPIIDHDEAATVSKIVKFASDDGEFFGEDKDIFSAGAIELIESCCSVAADARPTCEQAAGFRWFKGANVHNLYLGEAPDLGAGKVKKGEVDESWTRRQHSSIWSPQPERYTFGADAAGAGGGKGGGVEGFDALVAMAIREAEGGEGEAMDVVVVGEGEDEKEGGSEAMPPPRRASRALEGVLE